MSFLGSVSAKYLISIRVQKFTISNSAFKPSFVEYSNINLGLTKISRNFKTFSVIKHWMGTI